MKKISILLIFLVLCVCGLMAQAPEKFTYQAVVRNAGNSLVTNAQVGVRVSVLQGSAQGTPVFVETHSASTNANGLVTLEIGGGNAQTGSFSAINWADGVFFLKTEIDPNGGNNYSVATTQQLLSVPYALYAKQAENGFSGDYNDLTNTPAIPTLPTNVSAFTNDAGYITMDSIPAIPTVPTNVSAFTNDAGYLTGYTETDPQFNAWDKNYNDLTNTPVIPTVPTNVSAFTNDAGYLTGYTETDPQFNAWDKNYNDLTNKPVIPTVPTNVSAFTNDAGYLTGYTETDPQFNAWNKSYNDLTDKPVIPTVPTNVSAFTNDAGYITMDSVPAIPTNVSAFTNDAGYLTGYTETDPQFNAWDKNYNDLTNTPVIPTVPTNVSAFTNDAGYITMDSIPAIPTVPTNVSAFTNDAGYLTGYTETDPQFNAWDKNYNDLTNKPEIPTVPTNVSSFTNDAGYITMDSIPAIPTVPTNVSAFTNDAGYLTSANVQEAANIPTNVSAFVNDAGYITMDSIPAIPDVPTDVSAFNNDAGYITSYTETDPQFNAWNKSYNDLTDKPVIPAAANDATLTIQRNGVAVGTFSADATDNQTVNIAVPTQTSQLENNSGYITMADLQQLIDALNQRIDSLEGVIGELLPPALEDTVDGGPCPGHHTVTDVDGNTYNTVWIGEQCWMKENLRTTKFADGLEIPLGPDSSSTVPYRYCPNHDTANVQGYGYLYNWTAVMHGSVSSEANPSNVQGVCPSGWHVPSRAEWLQLKDYLSSKNEYLCGDNSNNINKALASTSGWNTSSVECAVGNNPSSNNLSGFSAVPAGEFQYSYANYIYFGFCAYFWSSTRYLQFIDAYAPAIAASSATMPLYLPHLGSGASVRCVLGEGETVAVEIPTVTTAAVSAVTDTTATCGGNVTAGVNVAIRGVCWSTTPQPTVYDSHTTDGAGTGSFTSNLTGLASSTTYYVRAYAANGAGIAYGEEVNFTTEAAAPSGDGIPCPGIPTLTDIDGNIYNTVQIGEQCWMKENLRTRKYPDGTDISFVNSGLSTTEGYCYYPNGDSANVTSYGYLYNWTAAMHGSGSSSSNPSNVQGVCPDGWHLPSNAEWTEMLNYLRSKSEFRCGVSLYNIAKAMASNTGWGTATANCAVGNDASLNNQTGFSAMPAGTYNSNYYFGTDTQIWSSTERNSTIAYATYLTSTSAVVQNNVPNKQNAYSVRCLLGTAGSVVVTPSVTTLTASEVSATTITCGGVVTQDGGSAVTARGVCWSTGYNPSLVAGQYTVDGSGTGSFVSQITGLNAGTTYRMWAYATNSEGTSFGEAVTVTTTYSTDGQPCSGAATVTDVDGNVYNTVMLGGVCWMKENLRTTKFPDGTPIALGTDSSSTVAYRYYPDNDSSNVATYGYLYNWSAFIHNQEGQTGNVQGICPAGWHVPKGEMSQLASYVSGQSDYICGGNTLNNAKAVASTEGWVSSSNPCTPGNDPASNNVTGFGLPPAGFYHIGYTNPTLGRNAVLWHANPNSTLYRWPYQLYYSDYRFQGGGGQTESLMKTYGQSVRCVRN